MLYWLILQKQYNIDKLFSCTCHAFGFWICYFLFYFGRFIMCQVILYISCLCVFFFCLVNLAQLVLSNCVACSFIAVTFGFQIHGLYVIEVHVFFFYLPVSLCLALWSGDVKPWPEDWSYLIRRNYLFSDFPVKNILTTWCRSKHNLLHHWLILQLSPSELLWCRFAPN